MHLLNTYALRTGSKITKPELNELFVPLPFKKYITIFNSSGMEGKNYDYWNEVIEIILPELKKNGYDIVQLGTKEDAPLKNCKHLQGATHIHQTFFLLKNSSLNLSNDTFAVHYCAANDIPLVALYSISPPEVCGPFWKNEKIQKVITPDLKDRKYSFNPKENPKLVNTIKPELIVEKISEVLGIDFQEKRKTVYFGEKYTKNNIEIVPNFLPKINTNSPISIRLDYLKSGIDYNLLFQICAENKVNIVAKEPFQIELLKNLRPNILNVLFFLNKDSDVNFVQKMKSEGFKYILASYELTDQMIFDYMDYGYIHGFSQENLVYVEDDLEYNEYILKSNNFILSDGKIYLTKNCLEKDRFIDSFENNKVKISLEEINQIKTGKEYIYIYGKKN